MSPNDRLAGAEMQVIGVAQDDLRAGPLDVAGAQSAHDAMGADRHERRRQDRAVRQGEGAGPGGALLGLEPELEHQDAACADSARRLR